VSRPMAAADVRVSSCWEMKSMTRNMGSWGYQSAREDPTGEKEEIGLAVVRSSSQEVTN